MLVLLRVLILGGLVSFSLAAQATHEADHRYRIYGTVLSSDGKPVADARTKLTGLGGRPLGETKTNESGEYEFRLHVHNQDLGTRFWVTANGMTREGVITFDPSDKVTERIHRIDLPQRD